MTNILFGVIIFGLIAFAVWNLLKLHQLGRFGDAIRDEIDRFYDKRYELIHSGLKWDERKNHDAFKIDIDIEQSYANYRKSAPWNHDFKSMISYKPSTL